MEIHSLEDLQDEIGRCEEFLEIMQLTSDELEQYFGRIRTDENDKFILFEYDTATIKHRILDDYILKTKEQKELDILYHEINQGKGPDNSCYSPEGSEKFDIFYERYKQFANDKDEFYLELADIYDLGQEQAFKAGFNTALNLIVKR